MPCMKILIISSLFIYSFGALAQPLKNSTNLMSKMERDTASKTPSVIHKANLLHLQKFIKYDVQLQDGDSATDFGKPELLHPLDAKNVLTVADGNPVVGLHQYDKYDPNNEGIGFCFGRAMFIHTELAMRGFDRSSIQKAFVVGSMETPDGGSWGWHVTTIAQSRDENGNEIWYAIDPIVGSVIEVQEWYEQMRDEFSTDKKLKLYITLATRMGPNSSYDEQDIRDTFYNDYFTDMMNWFEKQSKAGKYPKKFRVVK